MVLYIVHVLLLEGALAAARLQVGQLLLLLLGHVVRVVRHLHTRALVCGSSGSITLQHYSDDTPWKQRRRLPPTTTTDSGRGSGANRRLATPAHKRHKTYTHTIALSNLSENVRSIDGRTLG